MATPTQTGKPIAVTTPLGTDKLLLVGFNGQEGISQLFRFTLDVIAGLQTDVAFDKLLGQPISVRLDLPSGKRFFHGICSRVSQGESDTLFTSFNLEVVPKVWLLSRRVQSRIFQNETVPDILKKVFKGFDIDLKIEGTFHPRDYCVQYRESDFHFASRIMEEEGIFYFFTHSEGGHKLILGNSPSAHPDLPISSSLAYKHVASESAANEIRIHHWGKSQEVASGKVLLWDHCFEVPHKHLEAEESIQASVAVGEATHALKLGENAALELYDWPGQYAQRFDGVDRGGGDRSGDLKKIFEDNKRTTKIRMQQVASGSLTVHGASSYRQLVSGHKFTLSTPNNEPQVKPLKAKGQYVLTTVQHDARLEDIYRSGAAAAGFTYMNQFTCVPVALPFRPARATLKPVVPGSQTAVVVGPPGEEIFCDKYGRIKVQFHWDRDGKNDQNSSCWVRVGTVWAGKQWGGMSIPRVGQEVIVDFLEGDPDQPIVVGSVYNAEQMPAYKLPDHRTRTYFKSNTSPGGVGFNEIRIEDKKDNEQIFVHAQRNMDVRVGKDSMERVVGNRHLVVGLDKDGKKSGDQYELVHQNKHQRVLRHQEEQVEGNLLLTVGKGDASDGGNMDVLVEKNLTETVEGNHELTVKKDSSQEIGGGASLTVGQAAHVKIGTEAAVETETAVTIKAGTTLILEAGVQLSLKVGGNFIDIGPAGVSIQGTMVMINSGGAAGTGSPVKTQKPKAAKQAKPTKPTKADKSVTGHKSRS